MFCHKCGEKLNEEDDFCSSCGTKVVQKKVVDNTLSQESEADQIAEKNNTFSETVNTNNEENITAPCQEKNADKLETSTDENIDNYNINEQKTITDDNLLIKTENIENQSEIVNDQVFNNDQQSYQTSLPEETKQKKCYQLRTTGVKVTVAICSVIMSILIFLLTTALMAQVFIRTGLTEEKIKTALNNVEYTEVKVKNLVDIEDLSEKYKTEIPDDATIAQVIYYCIDQDELVNPISEIEVRRLVERIDFKEFLAEKTAKAIEIARNGSDEQPIYANEIIDFIRKNSDDIEKIIGISLLEVDYEYMQKRLEQKNDELLNFVSTKNLSEDLGSFELDVLRFLCSSWFIGISVFLIICFAVAIGYINRKISNSLIYTGATLIVAGLPMLLFSLLYKKILPSLTENLPYDFIIQLTSPVIGVLITICAVSFAAGAILLISGIVTKVIVRRRNLVFCKNEIHVN